MCNFRDNLFILGKRLTVLTVYLLIVLKEVTLTHKLSWRHRIFLSRRDTFFFNIDLKAKP